MLDVPQPLHMTPRPFSLLAELTHACPLHCPYCSNPLELARRSNELSSDQWTDVLRQAAALGVVHTQLVTSGTGLDEARLTRLRSAGLRSVQLSVQHADPQANDRIGGRPSSFA